MIRNAVLFLCVLLLVTASACAEQTATVTWIYDGDTLLLDKIGKVRLLGIDTPEGKNSSRDRFYINNFGISRKKLRAISRQAKRFNIEQVKGTEVRLEYDRRETDPHGRKLAYLYLEDGRMLNKLLLEEGLASVFRRYSFSRKDEFLQAEERARQAGLGLWEK